MSRKHTSSNSGKHPYLRLSFWKENKFWNNNKYSQASKDYYEKCLQDWQDREKAIINLQ